MKYYTDNNTEINNRIKKNKTFFFDGIGAKSEIEAKTKAKEIRSYVYEVYTDNKNKRRVHIGYAVPK